jgi:hypothetical protein
MPRGRRTDDTSPVVPIMYDVPGVTSDAVLAEMQRRTDPAYVAEVDAIKAHCLEALATLWGPHWRTMADVENGTRPQLWHGPSATVQAFLARLEEMSL